MKLVVGQGAVLIGVAVGLAGAFALTRLMTSLLVGVGATDTPTFVGAPVLLTIVALLAFVRASAKGDEGRSDGGAEM